MHALDRPVGKGVRLADLPRVGRYADLTYAADRASLLVSRLPADEPDERVSLWAARFPGGPPPLGVAVNRFRI